MSYLCPPISTDLLQEDFFYPVLQGIKEAEEECSDPTNSSSKDFVARNLTPDSPDSESEEEDSPFPGSFNLTLPRIPFITLDTPSTESTLSTANPTRDPSPERIALLPPLTSTPAPSPRKRLTTLPPTIPNPTLLTTPAPIASQPSAQTNQATTMSTFRMPLRGTDAAPKFDGTPARLIPFFEDLEQLADYAGLTIEARIKAAIGYAPFEELETWASQPAAKGKDWDKFVAAVKAMYPGCEGDRRYVCTDLENLCREWSRKPMKSKEELGAFYRKFLLVSQYLVDKSRIAELELGCYSLDSIHATAKNSIKRRLEVKLVDHHPDDPYSVDEVYNAAIFVLPSIAAASESSATTKSPTAPPVTQETSEGTVVKREYDVMRPSGCFFCGGDHFTSHCAICDQYVREGKINLTPNKKITMPDGSNIPGRQSDGNFKQRIDNFISSGPATGANATVIGGIYCRASPSLDATFDIEPSAFMHTCVEQDDSDDEELMRLEQEATRAREAFAAVKADRANRKDKGKNVCFEGVNIPPCPKPGPASKSTDVVEEVTSPQVRAAGSKSASAPNKGTVALTVTINVRPYSFSYLTLYYVTSRLHAAARLISYL
ncbi:hypothetical protein BDR03DRAFT_1016575 [Suillus americanus]|nr:hypothetical protein BDR03DRAFT_1016575 [Suillus americanus]